MCCGDQNIVEYRDGDIFCYFYRKCCFFKSGFSNHSDFCKHSIIIQIISISANLTIALFIDDDRQTQYLYINYFLSNKAKYLVT